MYTSPGNHFASPLAAGLRGSIEGCGGVDVIPVGCTWARPWTGGESSSSTGPTPCGCGPKCACRAGPGSSSAPSRRARVALGIDERAVFEPHGVAGHLYWRSIAPFHNVVFGGMARNITGAAARQVAAAAIG